VARAPQIVPGHMQMSPEAFRRKDLLYVANYNRVRVFSFPRWGYEGDLTGVSHPYGVCTDHQGHVYITDYGNNDIVEYVHGGGQPVRSLSVPGNSPFGCAVDPKSGDLAVSSYGDANGGGAGVAVYRKAKGTPEVYTDPDLVNYANCTYDDSGNLFVNGTYPRGYGNEKLAELPHRGRALRTVNLDYEPGWVGGVQWDGQYLALGQAVLPYILRYQIANGSGTLVGSTKLTDAYDAQNFILVGGQAIVVNLYYYDIYIARWNVLLYDYPGGGNSLHQIVADADPITSVALSRHRR
jgi:hypothetical protein